MSRSWKHTPVIKMGHGKEEKQRANRTIRRCRKIPAGKSMVYKKLYPQWDVCDYRFFMSKNEVGLFGWSIQEWKKIYIRK